MTFFKQTQIVLFLFILTYCNLSHANTALTLQDYRQLAINNNKALKMASLEERVAFYNKKEALSKFFPEVQILGGYIHNQKNLHLISSSSIPTSIPLPLGPISAIPVPESLRSRIHDMGTVDIRNIWAGGINLVQPIFAGGKIVAYNDLRAYAHDIAKSMQDTQLEEVILEVDNAYWQVVSITNKKKLAESYVELMQRMDNDIAAMEQEGIATKADRLSVKVKLNEAEMALTKAENGLSLAKMLLSQICGLEVSDQITLADEHLDKLHTPASVHPSSTEEYVSEALSSRSELKSLLAASKALEQNEKIVRADLLPQVALMANYIWTNPNAFDGLEKKFDGMWNVGVTLKIPLNFYSNNARLQAAKAQTKSKRLEVDEAKEKITLQVHQSTYKLNEAYKKLRATDKNTQKADENLRYANIGFQEGVIPASEVIAAHTAWLSAHSENIDAQIDVILCQTYLNKAIGRTLLTQ